MKLHNNYPRVNPFYLAFLSIVVGALSGESIIIDYMLDFYDAGSIVVMVLYVTKWAALISFQQL